MRCLSCHYSLKNLTPREGEHRCPECGREFDPDNSNTYDAGRAASRWPTLCLIGVCLFVLLFLTSYFRFFSGDSVTALPNQCLVSGVVAFVATQFLWLVGLVRSIERVCRKGRRSKS